MVSVIVDHFEADWSKLWWIVAEGRAEILEAPDESRSIDLLVTKYPQYESARPRGPIIAVQVMRWRTWSASPGAWQADGC